MCVVTGLKINKYMKLANDAENIDPAHKKESMQTLASHLGNALSFHRRLARTETEPHRILKILNIRYKSDYVGILYLWMKVLFTVNCIMQWYLLNMFLRTDKDLLFGIVGVLRLLRENAWEVTGLFPRVALCDLIERGTGSVVRTHTVQCTLSINLLNEKLFLMLYFWYLALSIVTIASLVYWTVVLTFPRFSVSFVARHVRLMDPEFDAVVNRGNLSRFVRLYLNYDGMLILRLLSFNSGIIFLSELVYTLWRKFLDCECDV